MHLHSIASDGTWSLPEIVKRAAAYGLTTISITDHDTVDAYTGSPDYGKSGIEVITGIEFSTEHENREIHILGYGIDVDNRELLNALLQLQAEREWRAKAMVERLNRLGCSISYTQVQALAGPGTIGRVHIAQALMESGYTKSIKEGFNRFLEINGPAYVPRRKLTVKDAIGLIMDAGGIPVLAHPGLVGDDELVKAVINMGLLGIEVIHSSHDPKQSQCYYQMARKLRVVPTGGSDCHGPKGKDQALIGSSTIPDTWVAELKQLLADR